MKKKVYAKYLWMSLKTEDGEKILAILLSYS